MHDIEVDSLEHSLQELKGSVEEVGQRQIALLEEQNDLAKRRTETTSNLLRHSSAAAELTLDQTAMARERTALTRAQTGLSGRSTELGIIRTDLARERTSLAEQRTEVAVYRTELAQERTKLATARTNMARYRNTLAIDRTRLSQNRTDLARERNVLAATRTRLSLQRTFLARGRTYLALLRTGLAILVLGLTLVRYFGVTTWTIFDGALILVGFFMVIYGGRGYWIADRNDKRCQTVLATDAGMEGLT